MPEALTISSAADNGGLDASTPRDSVRTARLQLVPSPKAQPPIPEIQHGRQAGRWFDEVFPEALNATGGKLPRDEVRLLKRLIKDDFVASRLQTREEVLGLVNFLFAVLKKVEISGNTGDSQKDGGHLIHPASQEKSPGIFERGRQWFGNALEQSKARAKELFILAQIRYEIASGPMRGGTALDFQRNTQRVWKDQKRWLSPNRRPSAARVLKREMPRQYNGVKKKDIPEIAKPRIPTLEAPSSIPDLADLIRLQVLTAVSGSDIAAMRARYARAPSAVIHEVLRRDKLRCGQSLKGVRLVVRQQLQTVDAQGGVFIARPISNRGIVAGNAGQWRPECTINFNFAPEPAASFPRRRFATQPTYTRTARPGKPKPSSAPIRNIEAGAVRSPRPGFGARGHETGFQYSHFETETPAGHIFRE